MTIHLHLVSANLHVIALRSVTLHYTRTDIHIYIYLYACIVTYTCAYMCKYIYICNCTYTLFLGLVYLIVCSTLSCSQ